MAVLKRKELEGLSVEDLNSRVSELRKELMKENATVATGTTPKSPGALRVNKKNIARLLTIIHEKNNQSNQNNQGDTQQKGAEEKVGGSDKA